LEDSKLKAVVSTRLNSKLSHAAAAAPFSFFSSTRWFITAPEQQSGTFRSEIFENHFSPPRQDISVIKKHLRTAPSLTTRLVNPPPGSDLKVNRLDGGVIFSTQLSIGSIIIERLVDGLCR
jgi:hypothetical protein